MVDLYRFLPEEMEKLVIEMGYPRYRADQILLPLYYKFPKKISDIKQLPKKLIEELNDANQIFETLMGDLTDGRKHFIQENSLKVANLDI